MATLTGKTGDALSKELVKAQTEQADQTALDPKQKVTATTITEKTNEILTDNNVKMSGVSAAVPAALSSSMYDQTAPQTGTANNYTASTVTPPANLTGAQGTVSPQAQVTAAQGTLSPAALATAQTTTMDPQATTQYQMGQLMSSIQAGQPLPPWAAPQVRKVSAIMQQRGLGSSSMAAAAMVQAVTESGIEIAKQDADKYATLQLANLNNQQQAETDARDIKTVEEQLQKISRTSYAGAYVCVPMHPLTTELTNIERLSPKLAGYLIKRFGSIGLEF